MKEFYTKQYIYIYNPKAVLDEYTFSQLCVLISHQL